jgi:hypothetical protein
MSDLVRDSLFRRWRDLEDKICQEISQAEYRQARAYCAGDIDEYAKKLESLNSQFLIAFSARKAVFRALEEAENKFNIGMQI